MSVILALERFWTRTFSRINASASEVKEAFANTANGFVGCVEDCCNGFEVGMFAVIVGGVDCEFDGCHYWLGESFGHDLKFL